MINSKALQQLARELVTAGPSPDPSLRDLARRMVELDGVDDAADESAALYLITAFADIVADLHDVRVAGDALAEFYLNRWTPNIIEKG